MPPVQQHTRINLAELKGQIVKKIGAERARRYFNSLNRLLGQKLSKSEFDKLCFLTLGRENLALHNQLIRSVLKNASDGRVPPPPPPEKEVTKPVKVGAKRSPPREDGYHQVAGFPSAPSVWSNGDAFPISPRKVRSGIRDRRLKDRRSPLGPNGKMDSASNQLIAVEDGVTKHVLENGDLSLFDSQRPLQHHQGLAEQPVNERDGSLLPPAKRPRIIKRSPHEPVSVHSKGMVEVVVVEDAEEEEQANSMNSSRSPLRAPLGIPFCPASVGGARRALPVASSSSVASAVDIGELFDSETLRKRMEQIVGSQGLDGVSIDCANLLNNGLDVYLKRLIKSCTDLVQARSRHEPVKQSLYKQQPHGKVINGVWPGQHMHMHMQSNSGPAEVIHEPKHCHPVSLQDFKVAMELNPHQLGEDWPLLLEKTCLRSCEE